MSRCARLSLLRVREAPCRRLLVRGQYPHATARFRHRCRARPLPQGLGPSRSPPQSRARLRRSERLQRRGCLWGCPSWTGRTIENRVTRCRRLGVPARRLAARTGSVRQPAAADKSRQRSRFHRTRSTGRPGSPPTPPRFSALSVSAFLRSLSPSSSIIPSPGTKQDRRDRAGRQAEFGPDPVLTAPLLSSQLQNPPLDLRGGAAWAPARTRGPVEQTGLTLSAEPRNPTVRALTRDAKVLGDMRHRSTITDHPLNEQTTTMQIQTGISVGHEDLLVGEDVRHLH